MKKKRKMFVLLCLLSSRVEALSSTTAVRLPKSVAVENMVRTKLSLVPPAEFSKAAAVIAAQKSTNGRVDQASVDWALSPIFKSITKSLTEQCREQEDCLVEYLYSTEQPAEAALVAPKPSSAFSRKNVGRASLALLTAFFAYFTVPNYAKIYAVASNVVVAAYAKASVFILSLL